MTVALKRKLETKVEGNEGKGITRVEKKEIT
jgi:hypothetical protein